MHYTVEHEIIYEFIIISSINWKGAAEEIQVLDWATIGYVSPAYDLIHNIFNSTDKELRAKEYNNLIAIYYKSLSRTIKSLGSDPEKLFTFENLKEELKRYGNFALIVTPLFVLSAQIQLNETNTDETGLSEINQMEYDRRINGLLEDVINLGYYQRVLWATSPYAFIIVSCARTVINSFYTTNSLDCNLVYLP